MGLGVVRVEFHTVSGIYLQGFVLNSTANEERLLDFDQRNDVLRGIR